MMGVRGLVPLVDGLVGSTDGSVAYHAAGVQGTVQLPDTCTGPPLSLPLSNSRLCSTSRPMGPGGQASAAVALSFTTGPGFGECWRWVLAMLPAVPRRRFEPRSWFSPIVLVWSEVPTMVALHTLGAFSGCRVNPFSLSSHSKPWLPAFCMNLFS